MIYSSPIADGWPLRHARKIAEVIAEKLQPWCEAIEIVGSIRRGLDWVGDVDIVCLPRDGQLAALQARCKEQAHVVRDGHQNMILRLRNGLQVDLFFAHERKWDFFSYTPSNFGSLCLCRTGSKEHNIFLVEHAKKMGLRWQPYEGVSDGSGRVIAAATEADIFNALRLPFIPPERRER